MGINVINGRSRERWFGVLVVVFISALSVVAFTVLSEIYLTFALYWFGMIIPIGAVLLTVYLLWSYRLQKGKMKTWVVALSGLLVMSFGALLVHEQGGLFFVLWPIGLFLLIVGLRSTFTK